MTSTLRPRATEQESAGSHLKLLGDHITTSARQTQPVGRRQRVREWVARKRYAMQFELAAARAAGANERGAVTAEYAIVIMAAVAFAGLLVVIMRSGEVQEMLTQLVQNALQSAG